MRSETSTLRERLRNRPVFHDQMPMRIREITGFLTLAALIALPAVFGLWQQSDTVRTRFEISELRKKTIGLQERHRCLRIEKGTLESLERVSAAARRAGLVPRDEVPSPYFVVPGIRRGGDIPVRASAGGGEERPKIVLAASTPAVTRGSEPRP